jgi:hypothetical protein
MCVATIGGDLVYDRIVMPQKPAHQTASLIQ